MPYLDFVIQIHFYYFSQYTTVSTYCLPRVSTVPCLAHEFENEVERKFQNEVGTYLRRVERRRGAGFSFRVTCVFTQFHVNNVLSGKI